MSKTSLEQYSLNLKLTNMRSPTNIFIYILLRLKCLKIVIRSWLCFKSCTFVCFQHYMFILVRN